MALKAHITAHGTKQESFQAVADALIPNQDFSVRVDRKSIPDRYEQMQKSFDMEEVRDAFHAGEAVDITEEQ